MADLSLETMSQEYYDILKELGNMSRQCDNGFGTDASM